MLKNSFFNDDAVKVAKKLLGKVIFHNHKGTWLSAQIIETEAYYLHEKGSHAYLGYTKKRKALFMPPGTIYMYYARGGDSLNVSCHGKGNAVLIKSGYPYTDQNSDPDMITIMKKLNPIGDRQRKTERLCSGQTLLCRSLGIKVKDHDQQQFDPKTLFMTDVGYTPNKIIQTTRLGIPKGRDEHLEYRFIDAAYEKFCTKKTQKN